jgi:hypothetical protein
LVVLGFELGSCVFMQALYHLSRTPSPRLFLLKYNNCRKVIVRKIIIMEAIATWFFHKPQGERSMFCILKNSSPVHLQFNTRKCNSIPSIRHIVLSIFTVSYLKVFRLTTSLIIIPSSTVTGAHNFGGCHAKQLASKAQLISFFY